MKSLFTVLAGALLLVAGGVLAQGAGPTDPQIAHIVVTANQVDIDAGKLAESKGSNKDVKAFGKTMVTDHTGVNNQATALVKSGNEVAGELFGYPARQVERTANGIQALWTGKSHNPSALLFGPENR